MTTAILLEKIKNLRFLVIGDLMLDHYIWGEVQRISPEAPVPVVFTARETETAGGAANVALNLAALGAGASLAGSIGQDVEGSRLLDLLVAAGVETGLCGRLGSRPTITKTRVIARTQQLCRIDREGPRAAYSMDSAMDSAMDSESELSERLDRAVGACDAVILSDYAKGVITQPLVDRVLSLARRHGKIVAVDPKPARKLAFDGVDLITPNRHEALELAGIPEPSPGEVYPLDEAARLIHEAFAPRHLIITLGAEGMAICSGGRVQSILPTRAREVYDVSGAGDTVIAMLTAAFVAGADPVAAAEFANLAAGIVVSKITTATPTPRELLEAW